jgi:uncharacterized lipoprotein YajG
MTFRQLTLPLLALGLAGCVTGRRTIDLPVTGHSGPSVILGSVYIASITDDRQFQNKPSDPSIPSIDGDVTTLSAQQRDQMIGRQRNGFGHAMGDISLPAGDSVTKRVRLLVEQGLTESGYRISSDPNAPNSISVSVRDFWSWMTPGFAALTFEAKIACVISNPNAGAARSETVKGYGRNYGQLAKDENWQEAWAPAFVDFIAQFAAAAPNLALRSDGQSESR